MTGPTDSFDDPAAWPTTVVQTARVIIEDPQGAVLLQRRRDDRWALPGGTMRPGESIEEAAIRRVHEQTGLEIRLTGLVGVYTDPGRVIVGDDSQVRQEFIVCFAATLAGGGSALSGQSRDLTFARPDQLTRHSMDSTTRECIDDHLRHNRSSGSSEC